MWENSENYCENFSGNASKLWNFDENYETIVK